MRSEILIKYMRCVVKEVILKKLKEIQELKQKIAERVWSNAHPVREIDEDKFDKKGEALTQSAIEQRTKLLAERLIKDYPGKDPVLVSLMDGGLPFANLLQTALNERDYEYTYTTMQASSYGDKMTSGELKIGSMPKVSVAGRAVFVVDDVCDTGKTYLKIKELLESLGAEKVVLVVLVDKVQQRVNNYRPEYVVFEVPSDAFIVGMGLDYLGKLRNKPGILAVDLSSLPTQEEQKLLDLEPLLNEQLVKLIALEKTSKPGSSNQTIFGGSLEKSTTNMPAYAPEDATLVQQSITTSFQ